MKSVLPRVQIAMSLLKKEILCYLGPKEWAAMRGANGALCASIPEYCSKSKCMRRPLHACERCLMLMCKCHISFVWKGQHEVPAFMENKRFCLQCRRHLLALPPISDDLYIADQKASDYIKRMAILNSDISYHVVNTGSLISNGNYNACFWLALVAGWSRLLPIRYENDKKMEAIQRRVTDLATINEARLS